MERNHRRILSAILLAATTLMAAGPVAAAPDWNRLDDPLQQGLGLHVGRIGGAGLAFRMPLKWYLQLQVAGGLWHNDSDQRHNVGVEVNYLLRQDPRLRLFLVSGWSYGNHREKFTNALGNEDWHEDPSWATGFGVGAEYLVGARWSIKGDVDFTYRQDKESITLWPQAGVFFYW